MSELVTRSDLETVRRELETSIGTVRLSVETVRRELETSIVMVRKDLEAAMERQTLKVTVRLGGMLGVCIAALATIIKL